MVVTREENGGIDTLRLLEWGHVFVEYVEPLARRGRKVLLVYDGYRAHLSLSVLDLFPKNNIIFYVFPLHTSGKTQPLDVVLFSVFKNHLQDAVRSYTAPLAAVLLPAGEGSMIYLIFMPVFEMHTIGPLRYKTFKLLFVDQEFGILILRSY